MDLDEFERQIVEENVRLFILCSPHNPVGLCVTGEELYGSGRYLRKTRCFRHIRRDRSGFLCLPRLQAPGIRGFESQSMRILPLPVQLRPKPSIFLGFRFQYLHMQRDIRRLFIAELRRTWLRSQPNVLGLIACRAAYEKGASWLDVNFLFSLLKRQPRTASDFIKSELPNTPPR